MLSQDPNRIQDKVKYLKRVVVPDIDWFVQEDRSGRTEEWSLKRGGDHTDGYATCC